MDNPLDCAICLEKYNDTNKVPRILKCGHTFCSSCLKEFSRLPSNQREKFIKCPLDKQIGHINTNYEELPINRIILDIIEYNGVLNLEKLSLKEKNSKEVNDENNITENVGKKLNSMLTFYASNYEAFNSYLNKIIIIKSQLNQEINDHYDKIYGFLENTKYMMIQRIESFYDDKIKNKILLQKLANNIQLINDHFRKLEMINNQRKMKNLSTLEEVKAINDIGIDNLEDSNFLAELKKQSNVIENDSNPTLVYKNDNSSKKLLNLVYENLKLLGESVNLIFPSDINPLGNNNFLKGLDLTLNQINFQLQDIKLDHSFHWFEYNSLRIFSKNVNESDWRIVQNSMNFKSIELFRVCSLEDNSYLITGGFNNYVTSNKVFLFKNGVFTRKENMNQERRAHSSTKSGKLVYVCGGVNHKNEPLTSCEKYEIDLNKWFKISSMNYPKSHLSICSVNNEFLFSFGGENKNECLLDIIEKYIINTDVWLTLNIKLPYKLECVACVNYKQSIIILGGYNIELGPLDSVYSFSIDTQIFTKLRNLESTSWSIYHPIISNNILHLLNGGEENTPPKHIVYRIEN